MLVLSSLRSRVLLAVLTAMAVVCVATVSGVAAEDNTLSVQVQPGQQVCFYEDLPNAGTKVFMHFLVTTGGALDIAATISGPDGQGIWSTPRSSEDRLLFKTRMPGRHEFCFANTMSYNVPKVVSFSVLLGDTPDTAAEGGGGGGGDKSQDSLQRSLRRIREGLSEVMELQAYMRIREREHRATTEVANTRVVVWSVAEMAAIVAMGIASVFYLRRLFTTKRYV